MNSSQLYGALEAGGTKFNCMIAAGPEQVIAESRIATSAPGPTLQAVVEFFSPYCVSSQIHEIGVGCFGPLDQRRGSPTYGYITSTPKPGWQNVDVVGALQQALRVDVAFETDVNAAGLGEHTWGASRGCETSLYVTVGTGIGAGFIAHGQPLHGLVNPEMGHIRIPHDKASDPFPGACPFHGDCFEGLAGGPAIAARSGRPAEFLSDADPYWEIEANYIASALATYVLVLSPERIVLGGGIMQRRLLFPRIRQELQRSLAGYVDSEQLAGDLAGYVVPPGLGQKSGALGAIALAARLHAAA